VNLWDHALHDLSCRLEPSDFLSWFQPVRCQAVEPDSRRISLLVPDEAHGLVLAERYLPTISAALRDLTSAEYDVTFVTAEASSAALAHEVSRPAAIARGRPGASGLPLNPRYRFDSFVDGPTNQFAMSAARAVADFPGANYNPLFIFGGVGLGKTHLLHAIGHAVLEKNPLSRVLYVTSEQFVNDLIASIQTRDTQSFRARYRDGCDVLLIDDIQFIAGKDRSQEEFFHMFNELHSSSKQIVMTSDQLPQSIPDLEDRLKSRLQWGLITDIKPPGFETRVAILKQKAALDGVDLPDPVAMFMARHITRNVRELEGALRRVLAMAALSGRAPDQEMVEQTLGVLTSHLVRVDPQQIIKAVAADHGVSIADMKGPRRHRNITVPRQLAMYLVRELTDESLPQIGAHFGGRDHSTVINSLKRVEALRDADPEMRARLERIRRALRP
jgi:chromosomal replication initiator protein